MRGVPEVHRLPLYLLSNLLKQLNFHIYVTLNLVALIYNEINGLYPTAHLLHVSLETHQIGHWLQKVC